MKKGFTLVEMLVVIGIIAVLVGASIAGYSKMTKTADQTKARELCSNVATALTAYFQREGCWPKRLLTARTGMTDGGRMLTADAALPLAKYLSMTTENGKLAGYDRCGILSHWGQRIIKQRGDNVNERDVEDYILRFAVDDDGDGIIRGASVGGEHIDVRATAIVWCSGKDGSILPYKEGRRRDGIYSWTYGQTQNVK